MTEQEIRDLNLYICYLEERNKELLEVISTMIELGFRGAPTSSEMTGWMREKISSNKLINDWTCSCGESVCGGFPCPDCGCPSPLQQSNEDYDRPVQESDS